MNINLFNKKSLDNKEVQIMIKSWEDYKNHDINVLRECLTMWSESDCTYKSPLKYKTIFLENGSRLWKPAFGKNHCKRIFFITTTYKQLKNLKLTCLLNNDAVKAETFIPKEMSTSLFGYYQQMPID